MTKQTNLRDVPPDLLQWIESEADSRATSRNQMMIRLLEEARQHRSDDDRQLTLSFPAPPPPRTKSQFFRFIDLFAGIGGFRLGLERVGGECVFSSEWNRFAAHTYEAFFEDGLPQGDINETDPATIPDHDILAAGFPCQPFSIAGVSKKRSLGQADGFDCERQGNLFFRICDIVEVKRPPVLILENVKNLKSHDKQRTWQVIESTLTNLGYRVYNQIIDAADYVPQHRERIFIVCFDRDVFGENPGFEYPTPPETGRPKFRDILESNPDPKYTLTDHLWDYLQRYAAKHRAKGNGFGYGIADMDGVTRTLSARYYKDGSEVLIDQGKKKNPRRLTIVEAARLMGFGSIVKTRKKVPVSDTQAYKQFGNAVVPDVVTAVGRQVVNVMLGRLRSQGSGCLMKKPSKRKRRKKFA